jgi:hypothetical protein
VAGSIWQAARERRGQSELPPQMTSRCPVIAPASAESRNASETSKRIFSLIRGRPQLIPYERRSSRTGMPTDEEVGEVSASTVKVAIPYGSKEAKKRGRGQL